MKKIVLFSTMALLVLTACGKEKSFTSSLDWNGTWEKLDGENSVCRDSFTFKGDNTFEIQNSRTQGGERSSGTYEAIEGNDYQFDYGGGSDIFNISFEEETMKVQLSGKDTVCNYNKVD